MSELELEVLHPFERVLGEPGSHRGILALVTCCVRRGSTNFPFDLAVHGFLVGIIVVDHEHYGLLELCSNR